MLHAIADFLDDVFCIEVAKVSLVVDDCPWVEPDSCRAHEMELLIEDFVSLEIDVVRRLLNETVLNAFGKRHVINTQSLHELATAFRVLLRQQALAIK